MATDGYIREFQDIGMNSLLAIVIGILALMVLIFAVIQYWFYLINKNN